MGPWSRSMNSPKQTRRSVNAIRFHEPPAETNAPLGSGLSPVSWCDYLEQDKFVWSSMSQRQVLDAKKIYGGCDNPIMTVLMRTRTYWWFHIEMLYSREYFYMGVFKWLFKIDIVSTYDYDMFYLSSIMTVYLFQCPWLPWCHHSQHKVSGNTMIHSL